MQNYKFELSHEWDRIVEMSPEQFSTELHKYPAEDEVLSKTDSISSPVLFFLPTTKRSCIDFARMWFWYALANSRQWFVCEIEIFETYPRSKKKSQTFAVLSNKKTNLYHLADFTWECKGCETFDDCVQLVKQRYDFSDDYIWKFV